MLKCEWACPTVNAMKPDNNIRICGNYSLTLNKCTKLVKYPLPSVEAAIARVGDAKEFSKIDLYSAYLQLPLDDESNALTPIKYHRRTAPVQLLTVCNFQLTWNFPVIYVQSPVRY